LATTFLASFPAIQSAIKISGSGDGIRVQLDIPESEVPNALPLLGWREMALRVTVEPLKNNREQHAIRTGEKRKSEWAAAEEPGADGDS
jgi:hypothetical protein